MFMGQFQSPTMIKKLTILLFLCMSFPVLVAQTDFRKGYIVKLNGDTLTGYVNFQKEALNSTTCSFKRFEIAVTVTYTPGMIKAYGIHEGKQYISIIFGGKPVFAEYLVKGKISLLYLKKGSEHFFTKAENQQPAELKPDYRNELNSLFSPVELAKEIEESRLTISSLTNLVKRYNELSNASFTVPARPKDKSLISDYSILGTNKVKLGLAGGMNAIFFKPQTYEGFYSFMKTADFKPVVVPVAGIFVKGNFSGRSKIGYKLDFSYSKVSIYGFSKERAYYSTVLAFNDIFIDYENVESRFNINYRIDRNPFIFEPYSGAGFHYRFNTGYWFFRQEYTEETHMVKTYENSNIHLRNNDLSLTGGINLIYQLSSARLLIFDVSYEYGNRIIEAQMTNDQKPALRGGSSCIRFTMGITL